jgi:glycosyltransferase involved in cell wall biosynthesis
VTVALDARYLKRRDVGISVYLRGMIDRLAEAGVPQVLLTDDRDHARGLAHEHRLRAVALPGRSGMAWEQLRLPRWLRDARPQALIAPANYGLPLVPVRGVRRIAVVHDLIPLRMIRTYFAGDPRWYAKYAISLAITLTVADVIVTPSEATASDVCRLGRRAVVVRRPDLPTAIRPGLPVPDGWPQRYVLYNGGRDRRKNVPRLLEAFARYRAGGGDHHLVLMGGGYEAFAADLGRLGLADAVVLPGFVPEEDKDRALAGAAAVVYPSSWEGFGLPLVEAFAAGIPVVCGRGGAQAEIGGDAALYVDVGDAESIAAGIARATEPGRRATARDEGARRLAELASERSTDPLIGLLAAPVATVRP